MDPVARLIKAADFAALKHRRQRRKDAEASPYINHPLALARVLKLEAGVEDVDVLAAAILHDTVEDTPTTREEIEVRFGADVASLVWAVTGVGKNRKERNANAYEKIRAYPLAATLKLADRIANVEASANVPDKLAMYRKEWPSFRDALAGNGHPALWERLRKALGVS